LPTFCSFSVQSPVKENNYCVNIWTKKNNNFEKFLGELKAFNQLGGFSVSQNTALWVACDVTVAPYDVHLTKYNTPIG